MEYSKETSSLLGNSDPSTPIIEDTKKVLKNVEEPTHLKAAWELMEILYADKYSETWIPERILDWILICLFSGSLSTVHTRLVDFQEELVAIKAVENDLKYWAVMASTLAVGWLVKLLHLHGSYLYDQLGCHEIENGLVQAVAFLISQMPRMRPDILAGKLGECYKTKPEFMKAWEKW